MQVVASNDRLTAIIDSRVRAMEEKGEVTRLLAALAAGDGGAFDDLLPLVYDELRGIAHRHLRGERTGHTLTTTDLVHEAYLSLVGIDRVNWSGRTHFLAVAARAMRRVLINRAVARRAKKRDGGRPASLDVDALSTDVPDEQLLELDEALRLLEARHDRYGRIVECRFFAGLSIDETAAALSISPATVKRDWALARAWLYRALSE